MIQLVIVPLFITISGCLVAIALTKFYDDKKSKDEQKLLKTNLYFELSQALDLIKSLHDIETNEETYYIIYCLFDGFCRF